MAKPKVFSEFLGSEPVQTVTTKRGRVLVGKVWTDEDGNLVIYTGKRGRPPVVKVADIDTIEPTETLEAA